MTAAQEQLQRGLESVRQRGRLVNVFFRDDDVDVDEPSLRALLALFAELQSPINLQIIPALLNEDAIVLLRQSQSQWPTLIELNQHGWRHINHEAEGRKCEFGPSRNFSEQLADIARGREALEQAFGDAFSPVFTPPWNRCTDATHQALEQLGFYAVSKLRGKEPVKGYSFSELSVTLDLFRWKDGAEMRSPAALTQELIAQLRTFDTVGVMLHHKVMDETAFQFVRMLIGELRQSPIIQFHTFQSLLRHQKQEER